MDYTQKRKGGFCLENATMFQIQDIFENGKPNIVSFPFIILILKSLKLGIVVLVMFNKMLVIVFTIDFYSEYVPGS